MKSLFKLCGGFSPHRSYEEPYQIKVRHTEHMCLCWCFRHFHNSLWCFMSFVCLCCEVSLFWRWPHRCDLLLLRGERYQLLTLSEEYHFLPQFYPGGILKYSALTEFYTTKCCLSSTLLCCFVKEEAAEHIYAFILYVWHRLTLQWDSGVSECIKLFWDDWLLE